MGGEGDGGGVGVRFERVVQWGETGLLAVAGEGETQQAVGEDRVLGEEGAVEVSAEGVAVDGAFVAVRAVVAVAVDHPRQALAAGTEVGAAAVVLEANQGLGVVGAGDKVANAAAGLGARVLRVEIEDAEAGEVVAHRGAVVTSEELVAAANGEHYYAVLDGAAEAVPFGSGKVGCDAGLLPVRAAADEDEVVGGGSEGIAGTEGG